MLWIRLFTSGCIRMKQIKEFVASDTSLYVKTTSFFHHNLNKMEMEFNLKCILYNATRTQFPSTRSSRKLVT